MRGAQTAASHRCSHGGCCRGFSVLIVVALQAVRVGAAHVSVVTWNILAPEFATRAKYTWASADTLAWGARRDKIVRTLSEIDADIICLQEVGVSVWDDLSQRLSELGYDGVLQQMSRNHPVANAILHRRDHVEVLRVESRSRALIAVLQACRSRAAAPSPLYLANVHLEAGADKGTTRHSQLRSLLRRMELQCSIDAAGEAAGATSRGSAPLLVCGDFNFDRSADLYKLLSQATPPAVPGDAKLTRSGRRLSSSAFHPLLPLHDAYSERDPPWGPALKSSYRNGRLLDFVWTSPAVSVLRTMPVNKAAGSAQPRQLPSAEHPSDHFPIGAVLTWPGAPDAVGVRSRPAWQQMFVENVQQRRE